MNRLAAHEAAGFARKYQFRGGKVRRVQLRYRRGGVTQVVFDLLVQSSGRGSGEAAARPVRLRLLLHQVAEFRFQMRPHLPRRIIEEARFGYWNGLFYLMLDASGLEPGEQAKVHDYRASEVYAAGRELYWQEQPARQPNASAAETASPPAADGTPPSTPEKAPPEPSPGTSPLAPPTAE
ncbi:MAG: hypothetical protein WHU94_11940 [Thermogemmata sp.]|jgi:hypothetical protein|uniref:Uncharacterized protein n=1 Tax=Thermogemmata fonticola TaxID=2755323 RepID=A0A7V8VDI1_9BACT|nr:hypothetical protein [Thermogemmata fonticola]MBA2226020.1 hypothetical protein [Thermogemmata fonticola]MCX8138207.1 hypothetical protein [Gemmataceae bacterium]